MANLTEQKRLVWNLGQPRPEPGHHVVVYRETGEGRVFYDTVLRGQTFRPPLKDRWRGSFVGYAVKAGEGLRHEFNEQFETGVGDEHDSFNLHMKLIYRVGEPPVLVERLSEDPLGTLEREILSVFHHKASKLHYQDLIDEHFDIGFYFLGSEARGQRSNDSDDLELFRGLAREFGIELDRVEVTRSYSAKKKGWGEVVVDVDRTKKVDVLKAQSAKEVASVVEQGKRQTKLSNAIADRLTGIANDAGTVGELRELLTEITSTPEGIGGIIGPQRSLAGSPEHKALPTGRSSTLREELQRMLEVVEDLKCSACDRTTLMGRILHVLAELCLGEESVDGRLERYVDELGRHCEAIDLVRTLSIQEHHRYFGRFRDPETVRQSLAGLSPHGDLGEEGNDERSR